jgi:drug/metabolite transporter superfamily protein YnfA
MNTPRAQALAEFKRSMRWIVLGAVVLVIVVLWYLSLFEPLRLHMVVATVGGVFVSMVLGCGLFAAAFFSDRSGHDDAVTHATPGEADRD